MDAVGALSDALKGVHARNRACSPPKTRTLERFGQAHPKTACPVVLEPRYAEIQAFQQQLLHLKGIMKTYQDIDSVIAGAARNGSNIT